MSDPTHDPQSFYEGQQSRQEEIDRLIADNKMLTDALLAKDGKNFDDACKEIGSLRAALDRIAQSNGLASWRQLVTQDDKMALHWKLHYQSLL